MSLEHMFEDEQEAWRFLLGEEFEMQESIVIPVDTIMHTVKETNRIFRGIQL